MLILFMEWNIGESVLVQDHLKSKVKPASLKLALMNFQSFIGCRIQNCYLTQNRSLVKNIEHFDAILFPLIKMMSDQVGRYRKYYKNNNYNNFFPVYIF